MTDETERIAIAETKLESIRSDTRNILKLLRGNGHEGLVTRAALNQQSIKRLWWFVGITTAAFLIGSIGLFWKATEVLARLPKIPQ